MSWKERKREWKGRVKETRVKRKGETEKSAKIPLSQGKKQVQKGRKTKKGGLGPSAQKYGCRVHWPQTQEENAEKRKTRKEEEGSLKRSSSYWRKRRRNKNPEKIAKALRSAAARPFLATSPTRTQNVTHPRPKSSQIGPCPERCAKCHFENDLISAAPLVFLPSKSNLVTQSKFGKIKIVRPAKINFKRALQNQAGTTRQTGVEEVERRKIAPKPFVFKRFASFGLEMKKKKKKQKEPTKKIKSH